MPTIPQSELPKPKSWEEFEDIVWDLCVRASNDPHAQRHGRNGQAQQGVDIYGRPSHLQGGYAGVQCKQCEQGKLTRAVIEAEIAKAEAFHPPLAEYTVATTHSWDATVQRIVHEINEEHKAKGRFPVHVEFWEDLCSQLADPGNRDLLLKHYGDWLPADLVTDSGLSAEEQQKGKRDYLDRVAKDCRYLDSEGVDRVRAELTDVFVMLQAVETPRPQERTDVAPVPERAEEMGLLDRLTGRRERREEHKPEQPELPPPPPPIPLATALGEHERLVILGEPGTGKTTILQFVALCFARAEVSWARRRLQLDESRIPVRIELRWYNGQERLDHFLVQWLYKNGYVPEALAWQWLEEGRLAVLLDGLDEVSQEHRSDVARAIESFATSPKGKACRIIITSRIAGYRRTRELSSEFGHYTICPLADPEGALSYTTGRLKQLKGLAYEEARVQAQALLEKMEEREGLRRVRSNPLLLRLVIAIHAEGGELAHNRAEVYRRYVQEVIWERLEGKVPSEAWDQRRWDQKSVEEAVEVVAWALQNSGKQTESDLTEALKDVADARDLIHYLREQLGLLAAYGYERGELVAFSHLTFREYFVARRLARAWEDTDYRESTWRFLRPRLHHPAWREPILLLAGMLKPEDATELVKRVARACSPYERELNRDLLLAAAIVGDGAPVADKTAAHLADDLERLHPDRHTKWWLRWILLIAVFLFMVGGLCYFGPAPGFFLIPLVTIIWGAALLLDIDHGFPPRLQFILAFPRRLSGRCEFTVMYERAAHELVGMPMDQHGDVRVRWAAAVALGERGNARAAELLVQALEDGDSDVRRAAAGALGKIGDARAVEPLVQALKDKDVRVRKTAAEALGKIGDARAVEPLVQALEDRNSGVRWAAAAALGERGDTRAVEPLVQALKDGDSDVRQMAAEALGKTGHARAVELLVQALKDKDVGVRKTAAEALGKIGDARAVEPLVQALEDSTVDVRQAAAEALGKIGHARAVEPLVQALKDKHGDVPKAAAVALAKIGHARAVELLVQALKDKDVGVRTAAAEGLGERGDTRAVELLVQALQDRGLPVRCAAAEGLGKIGDARAVEPLIQALKDKDRFVRCAAAEGLGKIGDARAVEPLIQALKDKDRFVRHAAAEALGKTGDARAVEPLVQALEDRDKWMREMAAVALHTHVQHEKKAPRLRSAARRLWRRLTDDGRVANAAYEALERTVAQLTELEVEALGAAPDPFTPEPTKAGPPTALLVALSILVAAILGIASNILAAYLQEQYQLITDPVRILIVVAVFVLALLASIWVALRLDRRSAATAE